MSKTKKVVTPTPEQIWESSKNKTKLELMAKGISNPTLPQIVYETFDRWSLRDAEATNESVSRISGSEAVKKEIAKAARKVQSGTHEQINASSQSELLINVVLGQQVSTSGKTFEKTAELKSGDKASLTNLAMNHRLRTAELPVRPELTQNIDNVARKTKDKDKYVLPGHTGAGYFGKKGTTSSKDQVVSSRSASSGKESIHQAQISAIAESSTHLGLSHRLSKVRDEFQEDGIGILQAEESKGFHPSSNWKGHDLGDKESVLVAAVTANQIFKKSQTKEKNLRKPYKEPQNLSETYQEIRTESETKTDDYEDYIQRKVMQNPKFKSFADKHKIDTTGKSFVDKAKALHSDVSKGGRTAP